MRPFILIFAFLLFLCSAHGQADRTIYGQVQNVPAPGTCLAKPDPFTGEVTTLSPASLTISQSPTKWAIDPCKDYYYVLGAGQIVTYDLVSGEIISNVPVTDASGITGVVFNGYDNGLYGLQVVSSPLSGASWCESILLPVRLPVFLSYPLGEGTVLRVRPSTR
jgi:hypothetical protein